MKTKGFKLVEGKIMMSEFLKYVFAVVFATLASLHLVGNANNQKFIFLTSGAGM